MFFLVDPVQGEGAMDGHHTVYFLGLLSDSVVRNHVLRLSRSFLLDESHPRFKQRYVSKKDKMIQLPRIQAISAASQFGRKFLEYREKVLFC